jgi:hypothetical protein
MVVSLWRIAAWSLAIGGVSFAVGFFGPMIVAPGANQGPLLGILITGPLGLVVGSVVGVTREAMGRTAGPLQVLRRVRLHLVLRAVAAFGGAGLAVYGAAGVRAGEGRGAAAALVIAAAALFYAATGRAPNWFGR